MSLKWIDSLDIAIELLEVHSEVDPTQLRFTELRDWVMQLPEFDDLAEHCGEKILEAIQQEWINEKD
ncbi:Protein IscX, believed to be involved in assembly of Fe-S clusters [hydrothermal vent metagenome]|uniref:Protein IscX, believed to be involved in assembly of Fe-S clusters n=1 Tax=hydrothermal vent metagenome TaxID=652676 RepID=A0A3B0ZUH8_9ZZZZ